MAVKPVKEFEVHPYVQFMMDKYSPYKKWIESEGVPIIGGAFVQDVRTEKLEYWKRKGCKGAICTFSDQMVADAYIAEIDLGKSIKPQRQLYEEIITVVAGRGATTVWYEGTAKRTFEWERGSTFAIPLMRGISISMQAAPSLVVISLLPASRFHLSSSATRSS